MEVKGQASRAANLEIELPKTEESSIKRLLSGETLEKV